MDTPRSALRINVSLGLVIVSLVVELLFVFLLGYGLYKAAGVVR